MGLTGVLVSTGWSTCSLIEILSINAVESPVETVPRKTSVWLPAVAVNAAVV